MLRPDNFILGAARFFAQGEAEIERRPHIMRLGSLIANSSAEDQKEVKAAFCILGAIGSGFALVAAGPETANKVVSASCRGTWVITPAVVKGQEEVKFVGDVPAPKAER